MDSGPASVQPSSVAAHVQLAEPKRAKLVMGAPLGESEFPLEGADVVQEDNEEILVDLPDDTQELELTHLRLRTLRGLGLERFRQVIRISLRQNLLSSLSYVPTPPSTNEEGLPVVASDSAKASATTASVPEGGADEIDEDDNDDEDAKKKEEEFEYHESDVVNGGESGGSTETVWPLRGLEDLEEIDLYDNRIKSVKGLEGLVALKSLDLSFNLLRSIAPLNDSSPTSPFAYHELDHLYLIQNKLSKIEGVQHRTGLVYLEFGGNRIRTIDSLPISANLKSLFLGKNKITKIENLDGLTGLTTLSIQSNRITKIEGLDSLVALEELYLSHNGITKIEGLRFNVNLTTLDVGNNKIDSVPTEELLPLALLEELWANDNLIPALPVMPPATHPALSTIYLEGNPVMKEMGTAYKRKVMLEMPQVKQIDATFVRQS